MEVNQVLVLHTCPEASDSEMENIMKRLLMLTLLALTLACESTGAPVIVGESDVDIAGTYASSVLTNADLATFVGCTGDLVSAEGLRVIDTVGACATSDPLTVVQILDDWQTHSQFFGCGSSFPRTVFAGAIVGDRIDGTVAWNYFDRLERQTITDGAAPTPGTVVLRIPHVSVSGDLSGACTISPPLEEVFSNNGATGIPYGPLVGGL